MKHLKNLILVAISIAFIGVACTKDSGTDTTTTYVGNWVKRSGFESDKRAGAVSFVIGNTAYVGMGSNGINKFNDLYSYNQATNGWDTIKQTMPGVGRNNASAFVINGKAYIVGGYCDFSNNPTGRLSDVWEFDPTNLTNPWKQMNSLPKGRANAVGFSIGNLGYICTGDIGYDAKDLLEFDPTSNAGMGSWTKKTSMPASDGRSGASVLVNNGTAYIFGGSSNGILQNEFWAFTPTSPIDSVWKQKRNITNTNTAETYDDLYTSIVRTNGAAFIVGTSGNAKGYYSTGSTSGTSNSTTWEYDFATDVWTQKSSFERTQRSDAVGFSVNGRGFIGLGRDGSSYFNNLDEFLPAATSDLND